MKFQVKFKKMFILDLKVFFYFLNSFFKKQNFELNKTKMYIRSKSFLYFFIKLLKI